MSELNENLIRAVLGQDKWGTIQFKIETPLTLRDFFAAFALAGTVASDDSVTCTLDAELAYSYADAMLAERVKEQK